jgi:hypothetical protein
MDAAAGEGAGKMKGWEAAGIQGIPMIQDV